MKKIAFLAAALPCFLSAGPTISNVSLSQPDGSRAVTVTYDLTGGPAVVTMDITVNGSSIGLDKLTNATGAVNRKVDADTGHMIFWEARETWPDRDEKGTVRAVLTAWPLHDPPRYMAVDLLTKSNVCYYVDAEAVPGGVQSWIYKTEKLLLRKIPAAGVRSLIGCNPSYCKTYGLRRPDEYRHYVTFSEDYYIGVYECTKAQHCNFSGSAMVSQEKDCPLSRSWNKIRGDASAVDGCDWPADGHKVAEGSIMASVRAFTGCEFDLPTEAQWEYACRAGTTGEHYFSSYESGEQNNVVNHAWILDNTGSVGNSGVKPVGQWDANPWGLYDMYGNVGEWCLDWFESFMASEAGNDVVDPKGPMSGSKRVFRGGHIADGPGFARSADRRYALSPSTDYSQCGFRLVCPAYVP